MTLSSLLDALSGSVPLGRAGQDRSYCCGFLLVLVVSLRMNLPRILVLKARQGVCKEVCQALMPFFLWAFLRSQCVGEGKVEAAFWRLPLTSTKPCICFDLFSSWTSLPVMYQVLDHPSVCGISTAVCEGKHFPGAFPPSPAACGWQWLQPPAVACFPLEISPGLLTSFPATDSCKNKG